MYRVVDMSDTDYAGTLSLYRNEPQSARRARGKVRGNKREPATYPRLDTGNWHEPNYVSRRKRGKRQTTIRHDRARKDIILQAAMGSIHTDDTDA